MADSSIINQLYQRKMFRIAVGYLTVAWLLWQVVDTTCPAFECSPAFQRTIFWLLLGGLPVTLAVAWVNWKTAIIVGIAFMAGLGVSVMMSGSKDVPVEPIVDQTEQELLPNSVAVLPLENLSPDPDNAYFAAGIHEEILNQLVKLSKLNVISRTSMVRYAESDMSIPEIAAELNVGAVMEGSVRYANDRVLVTMQLIDPETEAHLWSESYNRDLADVFAIQADIAMNVANALETEFSLEEQASIEEIPTKSNEAYALYLQAVSEGVENSLSYTRLKATIDVLERAIILDPEFALAYVRMARLALAFSHPATVGWEESYTLAQAYAEKALSINPKLGSAYAVLGLIAMSRRDGAKAREALARAYELSPNDPAVLTTYTSFNSYIGNHIEAIRLGEHGYSLGLATALGRALILAGEYERAEDYFKRQIELNPTQSTLRMNRSRLASRRGDFKEATEELEIGISLSSGSSATAGGYIWAYVSYLAQESATALDLFERVDHDAISLSPSYVKILVAIGELGVGNKEGALEILRDAAANLATQPLVVEEEFLRVNAFNDPALNEPEFVEVREKFGLKGF